MIKKVSVVTIDYNELKSTVEMIESLTIHETYLHETIVVGNASTSPPEHKLLQPKFPDIQVIRNEKNLEFAGGDNLGISYVTGYYLLFLNSDTIITQPLLKASVDRLDSNPRIGYVSSKIACWSEKECLQYTGSMPISHIALRGTSTGYNQLGQGQFEEAHETSFIHEATMAVKAIDIQKFGKMPEFCSLYYEELDWCTQIQETESSIWFESKAIIYHEGDASVGIESLLRICYHTRNRLILAQRILSEKGIRICSYIYQTTFTLCKRILIFTIQAKFHLIPFLFRGIKDGIYLISNNSR